MHSLFQLTLKPKFCPKPKSYLRWTNRDRKAAPFPLILLSTFKILYSFFRSQSFFLLYTYFWAEWLCMTFSPSLAFFLSATLKKKTTGTFGMQLSSEILTLEIIKAEHWAHGMRNSSSCEKDFLNNSNVCMCPQFPQVSLQIYLPHTAPNLNTKTTKTFSLWNKHYIHKYNKSYSTGRETNKWTSKPHSPKNTKKRTNIWKLSHQYSTQHHANFI